MASADATSLELHDLYQHHHGWLYRWLRGRLGDAEDAADLAHDTYVRLIASERRPQPGQSRRYLVQIAKGLVIDLRRRRSVEAAYLEVLALVPEGQTPSPETQALVIEALLEIDAILDRLPARARQAFLLSQLEGLTYADIAVRLGVTVSSVQKYMSRALQACYQAVYE